MVLAIAYAPVAVRTRLSWLLALDRRLADVLIRASEPMIAQLRLSWWRDAFNTASDKRPKGEPLLKALNEIGSDDVTVSAGLALIDAYEVLATSADAHEQEAARRQRIFALCGSYASWIGISETHKPQIDLIVGYWAEQDETLPNGLPRILRSLSILALAEKMESSQIQTSALRLNWHALTGR